ncbi:MAG: hypothetical protein ACJA2S_004706 [Cyclobacteriaceae bacterium]
MTTVKSYQSIKIKDERLDIDHIDQCRLSFFIGENDCQITVFDEKKQKLLLFESYSIDSPIIDFLEKLNRDHELVPAGFWPTIHIHIRNNKFCLVPNFLFDEGSAYDYIKLNTDTNPEEDNYAIKQHRQLMATYVFGYSAKIQEWFFKKYKKASIHIFHEGSSFLDSLENQLLKIAKPAIYLNCTANTLMIAGFNGQKLMIYNQVRINDIKQLPKIILMSIQQFSTDGQDTPVVLWGIESQLKEIKPLLKKYFKSLSLGKRATNIKMAHQFDEIELYEFAEIFGSFSELN